MAATGRETTIQLPAPEPRTRGLLVDVALPITVQDTTYQGHDRLGQGVQHTPWGIDPLRTGNADCIADVLINGDGPAFDAADPPEVIDANVDGASGDYSKDLALLNFDALSLHPAFKLVDGLTCSVISFPDAGSASFTNMTDRLLRRMRTASSAAIMGELVNGFASNGQSFSDVTPLTASANMLKAAEGIEGHLATVLQGNAGLVFIPPTLLHYAVDAGWVVIEGGQLYTATGHRVVSDAGHGVGGPTVPAGGEAWVFASGDVSYRLSDTMLLGEGSETLVLNTNIRERLAESYAQLAFDPETLGATLVTTA